eukprot:3541724-Pyramimonas_sp.AAC.1
MEPGRAPVGKRPTIEKSDQVYSNILDGTADDQTPQFPMRKAYEKAMTEVRSVAIPPAGEAAAVPGGPGQGAGAQSAHPFCEEDPAVIMPPPPRGGEGAPPQDAEADSDDDDGPG